MDTKITNDQIEHIVQRAAENMVAASGIQKAQSETFFVESKQGSVVGCFTASKAVSANLSNVSGSIDSGKTALVGSHRSASNDWSSGDSFYNPPNWGRTWQTVPNMPNGNDIQTTPIYIPPQTQTFTFPPGLPADIDLEELRDLLEERKAKKIKEEEIQKAADEELDREATEEEMAEIMRTIKEKTVDGLLDERKV